MNKFLPILISSALCFVALRSAEGFDKVQISAQKKKGEINKGNAKGGEGSTATGTENASYAITLQNKTTADLSNLTVDYFVFVERQKLGEKKGTETTDRIAGSQKIETLSRQPQTIITEEVVLKTQNLVGNYIYSGGGRIRAEDSLVGVCVRVTQDGQIVGDYALPSSMMQRGFGKK